MRFVHRVTTGSLSPEVRDELVSLGVHPDYDDGSFVVFEIEEGDPTWPDVQRWIAARGAGDYVTTRFSDRELDEAEWLELVPDWHYGYPQPREDSFGYLQATYNLTEYCDACGVGKRQKAPFQMRGEPKWGRRSILQLNWVFDEYFVRPEIWSAAFEPLGVGCRPVLNSRGSELATVVQLVAEDFVEIASDGLTAKTCPVCGRVKYEFVTRGPFPPLLAAPVGPVSRTTAWFGSGASGNRPVLIAQRVREAMLAWMVRGASMHPVARTP